MKTYPARFVGEFYDAGDYATFFTSEHLPNIGDVAIVHQPASSQPGSFLYIRCGCGSVDDVALAPTTQRNGASWRLTARDPVNIEPSIVSTLGPWTDDEGRTHTKRCHYFVHGGQLQMLDDTTATLK